MPIWIRLGLVVFALALGVELWGIATTSMQPQLDALHLHPSFENVFRYPSFAFELVPGVIAIFSVLGGRKWARSLIFLCFLFWLLEYVASTASAMQLSAPGASNSIVGAKSLLSLLSCVFLFLPPSNRWFKSRFQERFANYARSDRSRIAGFLLAFFFGFFGIHRFYLGKLATGFAFLALFIAGFVLAGFGASLVYVDSEFGPLTVGLGISVFALIITWMTIDALQIWHREMLDGRGAQVV